MFLPHILPKFWHLPFNFSFRNGWKQNDLAHGRQKCKNDKNRVIFGLRQGQRTILRLKLRLVEWILPKKILLTSKRLQWPPNTSGAMPSAAGADQIWISKFADFQAVSEQKILYYYKKDYIFTWRKWCIACILWGNLAFHLSNTRTWFSYSAGHGLVSIHPGGSSGVVVGQWNNWPTE